MRTLFLLIALLFLVPSSWIWAKPGHSKGASNHEKEAKKSLGDDEMDKGEEDGQKDELSDKSKFKEDSDDSYEEPGAGSEEAGKSKFKEEKDADDQETDDSDQG